MTKDTVIDFVKPSDFSPDPLTDLLRAGAQEELCPKVGDGVIRRHFEVA